MTGHATDDGRVLLRPTPGHGCIPLAPMDAGTFARFTPKVKHQPDGCDLWVGATDGHGYGTLRVAGRVVRAHRLAWVTHRGRDIPDGYTVDHLCRQRLCVNPDHLALVTHAENIRRGHAARPVATHCRRGHPYTPDNTYRATDGRRCCRACHRAAQARHRRGETHSDPTTCRRGHDLTAPDALYVRPDGGRQCRECLRVRNAEAAAKAHAIAKAAQAVAA